MDNKLARFEALAESLVEGTFARLFASQLPPRKVATHLARAMEDHQVCSSEGGPQAPTHYWVRLNPADYEALIAEQPSLEQKLIQHVADLANQADLALEVTPVIHVTPDEDILSHDVHIDARWMPEAVDDLERTREMESDDLAKGDTSVTAAPRGRPFLIVGGQRHVNLRQPSVSIGRALDNDVILEDPRVSRHHAQLRQRYGHYVLYDLGSSGGTQINGYPVEECVLHSGDVISFAGVQVIYGEDPPTPIPLPDDEDTAPIESAETEPVK